MSKPLKTLLLWGLLILTFLAIWQFLAVPPPGAPAPPVSDAAGSAWTTVIGSLAVSIPLLFGLRRYRAAMNAHRVAFARSLAALEAGRFDESEASLAGALGSRVLAVRRAARLRRAEIAARRLDRDEALARIQPAVAAPPSRFFGDRHVLTQARSLEAFLRASAGDDAGARTAVEAVRADPGAEPAALARAALGEALLLDHAGDRAALRELLRRSRPLVLQALPRSERALLRAFEAMLEAGSASVYREKADPPGGSGEEDALHAWMACYAPSAAPFARAGGGAPASREPRELPPPQPSAEARRKVEAQRSRRIPTRAPLKLLAWVALVVFVLVIVPLFFESLRYPSPWFLPLCTLFAAAPLLWVAFAWRRRRAEARRVGTAQRALAAGDLDRAAAELSKPPRSPLNRIQAGNVLAEVALAHGDMSAALEAVDGAFSALGELSGGRVAPLARPAEGTVLSWDLPRILAAQRSFALAGLGRFDEAEAELAWAEGLPSTLPLLRVRLLEHLHARDHEAAAELIESRDPGVSPTAREEVLFDLIRFVARPSTRSEDLARRLRGEIARAKELPAWLEAMAPGLTAAFERAAVEGKS